MRTGTLADYLEDFLTLKRAVAEADPHYGRKHRNQLNHSERHLRSFVSYWQKNGCPWPIRAQFAFDWLGKDSDGHHPYRDVRRVRLIRAFLRQVRAFEPETEVLGNVLRIVGPRHVPYIFSSQEILRLMAAARQDPRRHTLRPLTLYTLIGLLASTGLRIGEAIRLKLEDVRWAADPPALLITETKFAKSRQVILHPSTADQLRAYPIQMVRALTLVWLFAGLRGNEICRLRVGCVRWNNPVGGSPDTKAICFLDVPVNKTNTAFTKPVDRLVGEAVEKWERVRPAQPALLDTKTGELVHFLFSYRTYHLGQYFLNRTLIPAVCRKAGVPHQDARGNITSHRARSTIASQLFNAKDPMSLFELQEWLGHRTPTTTQYYAKITPTKLASSYNDADYFKRNLRLVEVLIDQDVVKAGAVAHRPWKFYDLGHGYCTYDFFDQCPHRMACAKCSFYRPKGSAQAQLLEGKSNLLRMRQEIPLREEEVAAVDEGVAAMDKLLAQLSDIPTPAGPTPRQLQNSTLVQLTGDLPPLTAEEEHTRHEIGMG
jgi:integrase